MSAHPLILEDEAAIAELVRPLRRLAVLGIKTEAQRTQPAFYVPADLVAAGLDVIPVPVYYPEVTEILRRPVYRRLVDVPAPPLELVDIFRRPQDLEAHLDDLLAARPKAVWFQLGIRHEAMALQLANAGIQVVQDRCLMIDHRRWARPATTASSAA